MLFSPFVRLGLLSALLSQGRLAATAPSDPCVKVAGLKFVDPADAMACQKSFRFNETLRQNVLSVVSGVFDFYTFEDFYLESPAPFQESTVNIRAEIARINTTDYEVRTLTALTPMLSLSRVLRRKTDYDFNIDLWNFTTRLHDGHTRMST